MTKVIVQLTGVGPKWAAPCQRAVSDLNVLFKRNGINVVLATSGQGPAISVRTDPTIQGDAVHGRTSSEFNGSGGFVGAEVRLPVKISINTPQGLRDAGAGVLEVVAAHEFVHALGHDEHNSHLMAQTMYKEAGDTGAGDKLKTGEVRLPPLVLSSQTVTTLQGLWP